MDGIDSITVMCNYFAEWKTSELQYIFVASFEVKLSNLHHINHAYCDVEEQTSFTGTESA